MQKLDDSAVGVGLISNQAVLKRAKITILIAALGFFYVAALALFPTLAPLSPLRCALYTVTGMNCSGCGLTRACVSLLHLHFMSAIRFNPLIVIVAPCIAAYVVDSILILLGKKSFIDRVPKWVCKTVLVVFIGVSVLLFLVRLLTWLEPSLNPNLWGVIPRDADVIR